MNDITPELTHAHVEQGVDGIVRASPPGVPVVDLSAFEYPTPLGPRPPETVSELVAAIADAMSQLDICFRTSLADSDFPSPRDVVAALLDVPRFWPALHPLSPVSPTVVSAALDAVRKIGRGAPLAYAVGRAAFRTLALDVDERVLIPRPETELIVDEVFRLIGRGRGVAIDVCTGSGAIALSLAIEGQFERVIATDISRDALDVARHNAELCAVGRKTPVEFRHGSLLAPVAECRAQVIVSNPPYIARAEMADLPASVADWEPELALVSGEDGLDATRILIRGAADILEPGGVLVLETDTRRTAHVAELLEQDARYHAIAVRQDLTGRERFVVARRS